jgi:hypothetical protein
MPLPTKPKSRAVTVAEVSLLVRLLGLISLAALAFAFPLARAAWIPPACGGAACTMGFVAALAGLFCASHMQSVQILRAALPAVLASVGWIAFAIWYIEGG